MTTTAPPRPAERHGFRVPLATGPTAAAEARRRVRAAVRSWPVPVDLDVALLLTSELVTNAVRHEPGQAVMLVISCSSGRLRVDVHDTSRSLPAVADVPADAETGRGLLLVETLSDEWGFYRTPAGKAVYFTLVSQPGQPDQPDQPDQLDQPDPENQAGQPGQAPAAGGRGPQRVHARGRWTETPPSAHRPRRADLAVPAARPPSALGTLRPA
jgi:anti-sigma regulatory factor (Ser/Thr protein kinase)